MLITRTRALVASSFLAVCASSLAYANGRPTKYPSPPPPITFTADLDGFQEVPAVSTAGAGRLRLKLDPKTGDLLYRLSFRALDGKDVLFAHIHFGQANTNGGVSVFLCTNDIPPDGVPVPPTCPPAAGGTVEGTLSAADVLGPEAQGILPGDFDSFVRALRRGAAYVNVHSDLFPSGEIRGQISEDQPPPTKPGKSKSKGGPPDWVPGPPPWVKGDWND